MLIDWTPAAYVGAAFALYGLIHVGLEFAMRGVRLNMVVIAEEILADETVRESDKARINLLLDNCFSFKVCLLIPVAVVWGLLDDILGTDKSLAEDAPTDARIHSVMLRFFASVLAANPVFGIIAAIFLIIGTPLGVALSRARGGRKERVANVIEEPMWRANAAVR